MLRGRGISVPDAKSFADRGLLPEEFMPDNTLDDIERLLVKRELLGEEVLFGGAA